MLQRLPVALAQIKADNTFEELLNEISQIIYSLYRLKENTEKSISQYSEFNKVNAKRILYLWILKIVKDLIVVDYYSILQAK